MRVRVCTFKEFLSISTLIFVIASTIYVSIAEGFSTILFIGLLAGVLTPTLIIVILDETDFNRYDSKRRLNTYRKEMAYTLRRASLNVRKKKKKSSASNSTTVTRQ